MSRRRPDWMTRLDALVRAQMGQPFVWGQHDCCTWAAEVAQAVRGVDVLAELRVPRHDVRSALRRIRAGGSVAQALGRAGLTEVAPGLARPGDLVEIAQGRWGVLAVCIGQDCLAPGPAGLACVPLAVASRAWQL